MIDEDLVQQEFLMTLEQENKHNILYLGTS